MKTKTLKMKLASAFLCIAMAIFAVFGIGGKTTKAFADQIIPAIPFNNENVESFAYAVGNDMTLYNIDSCFLVDSRLFIGETIEGGMTYEDVEDSPFMTGFINALMTRFYIVEEPGGEPITAEYVLGVAKILMVVNVYNTTTYVNLATGEEYLNVRTVNQLYNELDDSILDIDINTNPFYGAIVNLPSSRLYNMLSSLQEIHPFSVYVFPEETIVLGYAGISVKACFDGSSFTTGEVWE